MQRDKPPVPLDGTPQAVLSELEQEIESCTRCGLSRTRRRAVPGEGPATAVVMFVGEGPGAEEDASGRPFVGAAGQLLNSLLPLAGLRREQVFIANLVKCRPPGSRVPLPEEATACRPFLVAQIAMIQPQVICTLGSSALKALVDPRYSVTRAHGRLFKLHGILHYAMFHPAAALHDGSRLETLRTDMQRLGAALQRLDAYGVAPWARETGESAAQPSLFRESG